MKPLSTFLFVWNIILIFQLSVSLFLYNLSFPSLRMGPHRCVARKFSAKSEKRLALPAAAVTIKHLRLSSLYWSCRRAPRQQELCFFNSKAGKHCRNRKIPCLSKQEEFYSRFAKGKCSACDWPSHGIENSG